jgi:hypothetical protein
VLFFSNWAHSQVRPISRGLCLTYCSGERKNTLGHCWIRLIELSRLILEKKATLFLARESNNCHKSAERSYQIAGPLWQAKSVQYTGVGTRTLVRPRFACHLIANHWFAGHLVAEVNFDHLSEDHLSAPIKSLMFLIARDRQLFPEFLFYLQISTWALSKKYFKVILLPAKC